MTSDLVPVPIRTIVDDDRVPSPGPVGDDEPPVADLDLRSLRVASTWGLLAGFIPFVLILLNLALDPLRTAESRGFASNYYDVQARRLLSGHLTVPKEALGIEAFIVDGHSYMYFPPFPSILRMPVMLFTDRLDGQMTVMSMLLAWLVFALSARALLIRIRIILRGGDPVSRTESALCAVALASVTGGSLVVYLASHPWAYHEAYLWSTAFSTATVAAVLEVVLRPRRAAIVCAGGFALGAIMTRTTSGWPMSLTIITAGLWLALTRTRFASRRSGVLLSAAGALPLILGAALNIAKFHHPFLIPLDHQVWTDVNVHRRIALAVNDGTLAGPQFLPTTIANYLGPTGIRFVPYFPFVTLPAHPPTSVNGAFLDQVYRTGSAPAFMPLQFVGAVWAVVLVSWRRRAAELRPVRIVLFGAAAVSGVVLVYGYLAHRYVSEFLPVLVVGGFVGLIDAIRRIGADRARTLRVFAAGCIGLAAFGIAANAAVAWSAAQFTLGGDDLRRYVSTQLSVSELTGNPLDRMIERGDELPPTRPADTLFIVGECDALFLATGEQYEPWLTVEVRDLVIDVTPDDDGVDPGLVRLFSIDGGTRVNITLEASDRDSVRLRIGEGFYFLPTPWYVARPGEPFQIRLEADTARDWYRIVTTLGYEGRVPLGEWTRQWRFAIGTARTALPADDELRAAGVTATIRRGARLELCERLRDRVD